MPSQWSFLETTLTIQAKVPWHPLDQRGDQHSGQYKLPKVWKTYILNIKWNCSLTFSNWTNRLSWIQQIPLFGPPARAVTSSEGREYLSSAILYSTVTQGTLQIDNPTVKVASLFWKIKEAISYEIFTQYIPDERAEAKTNFKDSLNSVLGTSSNWGKLSRNGW